MDATTTRGFSPVPVALVNGASVMSATGNGITIVTVPWLVLELTGSATATAIVAGAATIPLVLAGVFSGTLVDRLGRRRVSVLSDLLSACAVAAIPLCAATFGLSVALLAALAFVGAMFDPAGVTARKSMLPEAATRANWTLDSVNSVYEAGYGIGYLLGPGIGGVLVATVGAINAQWITATLFAGALAAMSVLRLEGAGKPAESGSALWADTKDGLRFVWRSPLLRTLALIDMAVIALYIPVEGVLYPAYFSALDQPSSLGWVIAAMSAGGVTGALGYSVIARFAPRRTFFLFAIGALGICMVALAFLPPLWLTLVLAALIGVTYGPVAPIVSSAMQLRSPNHMRGRIVGVMTAATYAAGPLGFLAAGPLIDSVGIQTTFFLLAVPIVVIAFACIFVKPLHELNDL